MFASKLVRASPTPSAPSTETFKTRLKTYIYSLEFESVSFIPFLYPLSVLCFVQLFDQH